jgi:hypothetical protein
MSAVSKWLYVPLLLAVLLFSLLIVRWWPESKDHLLVYVIWGNLKLAWHSVLRGVVALAIIAASLKLLPPITFRQAALVAIGALVLEVVVQFGLAALPGFGPGTGLGFQLLGSAASFTFVLVVSSVFVAWVGCRLTRRSSGRVRDKVPSSYIGARAAQLNR